MLIMLIDMLRRLGRLAAPSAVTVLPGGAAWAGQIPAVAPDGLPCEPDGEIGSHRGERIAWFPAPGGDR